jgi:hypothetical protein
VARTTTTAVHLPLAEDRCCAAGRAQPARRLGDAPVLGSAQHEVVAVEGQEGIQLEDIRFPVGHHDRLLGWVQVTLGRQHTLEPAGTLLAFDRRAIPLGAAGWGTGIAGPDLLPEEPQR